VTFFDSNILIYFVENDIEFGQKAAQALARAFEDGGASFSVLALTELLSHQQTPAQLKKLDELEKLVTFIGLTSGMAKKAGELRNKNNGLTTPDSIHLATALVAKADLFITNDNRLAKIVTAYIATESIV